MNTQNVLLKKLTPLNVIFLIFMAIILSPQNTVAANETAPIVKTLRVNNYDMAYIEKGKGEPLILVHGSLSDYRTWLPLLSELSENNHVIAVSLRHYYPEKWNGKGADLSLQQHADDLAVFIQALNVGPVNLLGHSRGGAVALLTASKNPDLMRRLILADPAPLSSMLDKTPEVQALKNIRTAKFKKVIEYYKQGDTDGGLKEFVNYIAGPASWKNTPEVRRNNLRANAWTPISLLDDLETPFNCSNVRKIDIPLLLITGDHSAPIFGFMNSALKKCFIKSSVAIIADAGHMMFNANPSAFIFEVQDFIVPQ